MKRVRRGDWKQRRVDNDGIRSSLGWRAGCKTVEFHPFRARTGVAFLHVSPSETTFLPIRRNRCHTFLTLFIDGEQKRTSNQIPSAFLAWRVRIFAPSSVSDKLFPQLLSVLTWNCKNRICFFNFLRRFFIPVVFLKKINFLIPGTRVSIDTGNG